MRCRRRQLHTLHGDVFRIDDAWRDALSSIGITEGIDWTRFEGDALVSTSLATKCYRCDVADRAPVFFKRYVYPRRFWLEFWMRPAKGAVECWAYSRLHALQIPSLEVIAFGERRRLGMLLASGIVTAGVADSMNLEAFVRDVWCHWPKQWRVRVAREIAERLLSQLRVAHAGRFFHHDLKLRNLLINSEGDPASLVWIDAPRASRMRWRARRGVVTDLSALARIAINVFSRSELMRFLHMYLAGTGSAGEAKRLFREVGQHLARRMPRPLDLSFPD